MRYGVALDRRGDATRSSAGAFGASSSSRSIRSTARRRRLVASRPCSRPPRGSGTCRRLQVVPPFYDDPRYIACFAEVGRAGACARSTPSACSSASTVFPSDRSERATRPGRTACARRVLRAAPRAHRTCWRDAIARSASRPRACSANGSAIAGERRIVCFQSRLGRTPWIRPFTDVEVRDSGAARRQARGDRRPVVRRRLPRDARGDRHPGRRPIGGRTAARRCAWCRRSTRRLVGGRGRRRSPATLRAGSPA